MTGQERDAYCWWLDGMMQAHWYDELLVAHQARADAAGAEVQRNMPSRARWPRRLFARVALWVFRPGSRREPYKRQQRAYPHER
jgi:hypothetical protein